MTESEAKVILESEYKFHGECSVFGEALTIAIKALEENEQYKVLGTVEELRIAKGKQIPKKPTYEGDGYADGQLVYDTWICPCCEKHYEVDYDNYDFCPNCGQTIDWSDKQ